MNYFRALFDSVSTVLTAEPHSSPSNEDPSLSTAIELGGMNDEDDDEEDEQELDAEVFSLELYRRAVEAFYGRPLQYVADILFNMQRFQRGNQFYWMMDIDHPLSRLIHHARLANPVLMVRVEFAVHRDLMQVVYQDALIADVLETMVGRFEEKGFTLQSHVPQCEEDTPQQMPQHTTQQMPQHTTQHMTLVPLPLPIILPEPVEERPAEKKPEGGKKND